MNIRVSCMDISQIFKGEIGKDINGPCKLVILQIPERREIPGKSQDKN